MTLGDRVRLRPGFVALVCAGIYFGSARLLGIFLLAALAHELGHIAMAKLLGLHIHALTLSAQGAELELLEEHTSFYKDMLLCLSGPMVNLLWVGGCAAIKGSPLFLGANLLLGAFNLLPVRPLDGGNALYALLSCLTDWQTAQRVTGGISLLFSVVVTVAGLLLFCAEGGKPFLMLLGFWLLGGSLSGKVN